MRVVVFCHSLVSDWNHGNAHFLRGVCTELRTRGHAVEVYEPADAWSVENLLADHGHQALARFHAAYPLLQSRRYSLETLDLDRTLDHADLVLVHEWNDPELVRRIGERRARSQRFRLLFHDTHHRSVTKPEEMARYDLRHYDGVLAFGEVIRQLYLRRGWTQRAWTWHEAVDPRVFHPLPEIAPRSDLAWVGNWGDEERTAELRAFLIEPVKALGISGTVNGVRYPKEALVELKDAGLAFGGWVPNFEVPTVFARHRLTVHVPRRPYVEALPGIPTIRPFEALACGIPLVSAPWDDAEGLFTAGRDYLVARTGAEMKHHLRQVLSEPALSRELVANGLRTVLSRHTCAHRVDALLEIHAGLRAPAPALDAAGAMP